MSIRDRHPSALTEAAAFQAQELYAFEMYHWKRGTSEFVYDEELDIFRFPEDGGFAFCDEFADWKRLRERPYMPH